MAQKKKQWCKKVILILPKLCYSERETNRSRLSLIGKTNLVQPNTEMYKIVMEALQKKVKKERMKERNKCALRKKAWKKAWKKGKNEDWERMKDI